MRLRHACLALLLFGCAAESEEVDPPASSVTVLPPEQHLARASMVLRGVRPSVEELERVAQDPAELDRIVDEYVDSEGFGRTMRQLHNESLLIEVDWLYYPAGFPNVDALAELDMATVNRSVMEAPLRLIETVVMEDRPYTEVVTADFAMADAVSSQVWGLAYDPEGPAWQKTRYEDGRGNAGVLTDSWLYVRFQSTPSNANRQRANAVSRALLCYDFLSRDVALDTTVNAADPNAVQEAVVDNAACASCHQALDPLASFFKDIFPLVVPQDVQAYPVETPMWFPGVFEEVLAIDMRPPSYFGLAGETLEDLGQLIADDPRFSLCAAQRFYAHFNQVPLDQVPFEAAAELQETFIDSGFSAKALAKAIVLRPDFAASHATDEREAELVNGYRRARPDEYASLVEDLTGFRWETDLSLYTEGLVGVIDLPRDSMLGYRVIAGGTDGAYVVANNFTDNAGTSLFVRGFAERAAGFVVDADLAEPDPARRRLLRSLETGGPEGELRAQLAELHGRVFGRLAAPDSPEVGEMLDLLRAASQAEGSAQRAWKVLLTALLSDFRATNY